MKNTHRTGLTSHLAIAKRLVELGYEVLEPFDDSLPYDLAYVAWTKNGWFRSSEPVLYRVQCKTARYYDETHRNGCSGMIIFNGYTNGGMGNSYKRHGYWGEAEYFGVYCAELDKCYLVPVQAFPEGVEIRLRVKKTKNNQEKRVTWAKDYEL
jgi:hypothetical protein